MNHEKAQLLADLSRFDKNHKSGVAYRIVGKSGENTVYASGGYRVTGEKKDSKFYHSKHIAEMYVANYGNMFPMYTFRIVRYRMKYELLICRLYHKIDRLKEKLRPNGHK